MTRSVTARGAASRLAVTGAVLATVAGCLTLVAPAAANAATCPYYKATAGKSNNLKLGTSGVAPTGGTIFTATCTGNDFDITAVSATDEYEGWLYSAATHKWAACQNGWIGINGPVKGTTYVMCQDVRAGVEEAIVQSSSHIRNITVDH